MTKVLDGESHYLTLFDERETDLKDRGPTWLHPLRRAAIARFGTVGFPTRKEEAFKYTNLRAVTSLPFRASSSAQVGLDQIDPLLLEGVTETTLVFVDGMFRPDLSRTAALPAGVTLGNLADALARDEESWQGTLGRWGAIQHDLYRPDHAFTELNHALFEDGFCLQVRDGVSLDAPIQVVSYSTRADSESLTHLRNVVVLGRESQAQIIEIHGGAEGGEPRLNNIHTEAFVAQGARLDHHKVQQESPTDYHIANLRVAQERDSHFETGFYSFGGAVVRHEVEIRLLGEGCESTLNGLYLSDGERQVDNTTTIHHAQPHCHSREVYKGILSGRAQGVFNGKIYVHQDAQKTDAEQSNDSLLLSPDATINTRPNLEIYADDVRCTHGATIGQLRDDALFYLRSRGISKESARMILVRAFAHEVIDGVRCEVLRSRLDELLAEAVPSGADLGA